MFIDTRNGGGIAYSEDAQSICLVNKDGKEIVTRYRDIIGSEIIEDGVQVTTSSKVSQIGGALAGGVLAGGVGAVIGGMTGSNSTSTKIRKMELKIVVNNIKEPIFLVALANENTSRADAIILKGEGWEIKSIMETASGSIREVFPDATFRERRSILLDIGKATYKAFGELDQKTISNDETEQLRVTMVIDPYQPLLDVDWIEDRMERLER